MSRAAFYAFKNQIFEMVNKYIYNDNIDLEIYLDKLPIKQNCNFTYTNND